MSVLDRRQLLGLPLLAMEKPAFAAAARPVAAIDLRAHERARVLKAADAYLGQAPITITASSSPRSAGGKHDYFSEGDYWWPNPKNPDGPYVQRDGLTNPDNFVGHRTAMVRLSLQVPALAAAWLVTRQRRYADHGAAHLRAWFLQPETRMNPHLFYSQAVRGRSTGRSYGIIDTIHLVEVVRAASVLEGSPALSAGDRAGLRGWFAEYLTWLTTDFYGKEERKTGTNHATSWTVQVAELARYTGHDALTRECRRDFKNVLLPQQLAADGGFTNELARTKPYGYSLFHIDLMATLCQILSAPVDDLWAFALPDGRSIRRAVAYIYPFILDKRKWPLAPDVMYWDNWPVRHPALLFAGLAFSNAEYVALWKKLDPDPTVDEIIRNFPVRQPLLWVGGNARS